MVLVYVLLALCLGGACGYMFGRQQPLQDVVRLNAEKQALEDKIADKITDMEIVEKKFSTQFENLANRIFDEKNEKFKKESQEGIGQMLEPLRERLQEFQKKVDTSFQDHAKEQFSLKNEIKNIIAVNEKMTTQTDNLTRALKGDVKAQGNWGEVMLEKILADSGLRKDQDYILQGAGMGIKHTEHGGTLKPDVVIMLPDNKHLIVDAKVSLTAYERYCGAEDDAERALHLKKFQGSIRKHVDDLEKRRYQDTDTLGTSDFVLMFMPVEGAYSLALQQDTSLHSYAWDKKVIIVCPTTLFATLKTVASVWRVETQNRHVQEIAKEGGGLYDKVVGFVDDMQKLGTRIEAVRTTYDDTFKKLHEGRGSITTRVEKLRKLGAKTNKQLPVELVAEDEAVETPLRVENG